MKVIIVKVKGFLSKSQRKEMEEGIRASMANQVVVFDNDCDYEIIDAEGEIIVYQDGGKILCRG